MIHARTDWLKKLWAVLAVALMLHTQAAWACANLVGEHAEPAPCCGGDHPSTMPDHSPACDDPSSDALCAKPFAHGSASPAASQAHDGERDDHADAGNGDDGSAFTSFALPQAFAFFAQSDPPTGIADPYRTLAPARWTYLKTLRLRI